MRDYGRLGVSKSLVETASQDLATVSCTLSLMTRVIEVILPLLLNTLRVSPGPIQDPVPSATYRAFTCNIFLLFAGNVVYVRKDAEEQSGGDEVAEEGPLSSSTEALEAQKEVLFVKVCEVCAFQCRIIIIVCVYVYVRVCVCVRDISTHQGHWTIEWAMGDDC